MAFPCRLAVAAVLLVLALLLGPVAAIDSKCSACQAVAAELQRRMDKEVPRNHIDLRHRLDGEGNRYGKMIPYNESEERVTDLLDELCNEMTKYSLLKYNETEGPAYLWTKVAGEGKKTVDRKARPHKAEEEHQRKELKSYCARILDEMEEDLSSAIREGETERVAVSNLMCNMLTTACKKKSKKKKPVKVTVSDEL